MKTITAILLLLLLGAALPVLAADPAKVELRSGQYQITGATYSAIVPPTGLLSFLKIGEKVIIDKPFDLCVGTEWNTQSRQRLCATITRPAPDTLLCDGPDATLRYQFGPDSLVLSMTGKAERGARLFFPVSKLVEAVWTDGRFLGPYLHAAGSRTGDYSLHTAKVFSSGQVLTFKNMGVFYGPDLMRFEAGKGQTFTTTWQFGPAGDDDHKVFPPASLYRESLTVLSPVDYQVFQRQTATQGQVRIAGRLTVACDRLEFRIQGADWQPIRIAPQTGDFAAEFNAPAGGWYRCELRAMKDGKEVVAKTIAHIGVGEVFVAAGQSNSTNNGDQKLKPISGMVATFSGNEWRLADDPQPGCYDVSNGGSIYPPLGDLLYEHYKVPIAFAVTGMGGSSLSEWHPGGELFAWMQTRIEQLGPQGFRCMLWHQGEADASTPEEEYYDRLKTIIEQSNLRAGWSFPWMVAQVGGQQTKKAKERLWADGVALEGPNSDTLLGPENRQQNGKSVHFTELGLRRHAALWGEKLIAYLNINIKE